METNLLFSCRARIVASDKNKKHPALNIIAHFFRSDSRGFDASYNKLIKDFDTFNPEVKATLKQVVNELFDEEEVQGLKQYLSGIHGKGSYAFESGEHFFDIKFAGFNFTPWRLPIKPLDQHRRLLVPLANRTVGGINHYFDLTNATTELTFPVAIYYQGEPNFRLRP
jgi:hypothetical protein